MPTPKARMGIIGGAGPMAGALLFNKIIKICQQRYACASDADFPFISLVNYPFADMLTTEKNHAILSRQLDEVFRSFTDNRISICAIACNTLHTYLPPIPKELHLVHMIKETARVVSEKNPLVLCTSTAAKVQLHRQFFHCRYPEATLQQALDRVIDEISFQDTTLEHAALLNTVCDQGPIILGCTELSLLQDKFPLALADLYDPNSIVAEKLCALVFENACRA